MNMDVIRGHVLQNRSLLFFLGLVWFLSPPLAELDPQMRVIPAKSSDHLLQSTRR